MRHTFPYINGKPSIVLELINDQGRQRYVEFLIDTGADQTVISSTNILIDLDYKDIPGPEVNLEMANSSFFKAKQMNFVIKICGGNVLAPVYVVNQVIENLLGRRGIFEHFDITFQETKQQVIFKEV